MERAQYGKRGVLEKKESEKDGVELRRSVEKTPSVETMDCGKDGVWKRRLFSPHCLFHTPGFHLIRQDNIFIP